MRVKLEATLPRYRHESLDIRDREGVEVLVRKLGTALDVVVHTAAQPSHDWAAREPHTDFGVNALGTLNLREACRQYAPAATFIFISTNKVYGDTPNRLAQVEEESRWEIDASHLYHAHGIDESLSIDLSRHCLFGASKVEADMRVQGYGRYFGMKTGVFRGRCLTGPAHAEA